MANRLTTLVHRTCLGVTFALLAMCPVNSHAQYLYWTGAANRPTEPNVLRAGYDNGTVEGVFRATGGNFGIAIDADRLFLAPTELGVSTIFRSRLDGSESSALVSGYSFVNGLAFNSVTERLYFHDNALQRFVSLSADGADTQAGLVTGSSDRVKSLAVDGADRFVYWTQDYSLWRAPLDGGAKVSLAGRNQSLGLEVHSVALDAARGHVYWSEWHPADSPELFGGRIRRANLDGSDIQTILSALPVTDDPGGIHVGYLNPTYLAIDPVANYLFVYNEAFGDISRANLDGSNFDDQFIEDQGVLTLGGMAVLPAVPEPSTAALAVVGIAAILAWRRRALRRIVGGWVALFIIVGSGVPR